MKLNTSGAPSGIVCFLIIILDISLVKVQIRSSSTETSIPATLSNVPSKKPLLVAPVQVALINEKPGGIPTSVMFSIPMVIDRKCEPVPLRSEVSI